MKLKSKALFSMKILLAKKKRTHFKQIGKLIPKIRAQFIVVTHLIPNNFELINTLATIAPIALLVAIPYSLDHALYTRLHKRYNIIVPPLKELTNPQYLLTQILSEINPEIPTIILEIGGYFAAILNDLAKKLKELIGIIEDTESGHRQYEKLDAFPVPIISIAHSHLKKAEDFLIGNACLFSTERLIRKMGNIVEGRNVLILGFGKIGRGLAHTLLRRGCLVNIYDLNPTKLTVAISEGFYIPKKIEAIKKANIIFGTTGCLSLNQQEYKYIKNGAVLASCSSKDVEFDLNYLRRHYKHKEILPHCTEFTNKRQRFYLLADGHPVNFLDGSPLGAALALSQSEIILAIKEIIKLHNADKKGIFELERHEKTMLSEMWIKHFCDPITGYYSD